MKNSIYVRLMCLILLSALVLTQNQLLSKAQVTQTNNLTDPKELEAFLDPIFAERMEKSHIPGAVISVVKDGKIIFTKGYGVADIEKKTPVVPDQTIFRIGSITKVFTALAVVQQSDRRKIKLTDDVNKYLTGAKVPNTFPQPITFHDLLTHSSGLDDIGPGRHTDDENKVVPLGEFLKTRIVRHAPPGEIISYSTYSTILAALAVEQITKTPFTAYLQKNIFEPLGMNRTSIQAVKSEYKQDLATGYVYDKNIYQKLPFEWSHTYPAGSINSTATDMARFMIANLQMGAIDGKRILSGKAAREMQATQFRNHPKIPGWAYGFQETEQNGLRLIEHGGSNGDGYSALMMLVPEKNLGIFVACNIERGGALAEGVKNKFLDRYFPLQKKKEMPQTKNPAPSALREFAGKYRSIIYCHACLLNTSYLPPNTTYPPPTAFEVKVTDDGMLSILGTTWKQIEPMLLVRVDGETAGRSLLGFKKNSKGEIAYMFQNSLRVFEKDAP